MNEICFYDPTVHSIRYKGSYSIPFSEFGTMRNEKYSEPRCYCCGSPSHTLLSQARTRSNIFGKEYTCPVVAFDEPLYNESLSRLNLNFYPCPYKFASYYNFCVKVIERRIDMLYYHGFGYRHICNNMVNRFRAEVLRICNQHHIPSHSPDTANHDRLIPDIQNS